MDKYGLNEPYNSSDDEDYVPENEENSQKAFRIQKSSIGADIIEEDDLFAIPQAPSLSTRNSRTASSQASLSIQPDTEKPSTVSDDKASLSIDQQDLPKPVVIDASLSSSSVCKRKVQEELDRMFSDDFTSESTNATNPLTHSKPVTTTVNKPTLKKRKTVVLNPWETGSAPSVKSIFSKTRLDDGARHLKELCDNDNHRNDSSFSSELASSSKEISAIEAALDGTKVFDKGHKTVVTETVKFAGKITQITRTVTKGSDLETKLVQKKTNQDKRSKLEKLVDALKTKKDLTTIGKSQLDWEVSKEQEGDGESLKEAARNGYLVKMDFLTKADQLQFEKEKEQREEQRRIRARLVRQEEQARQSGGRKGL